MKNKNRLIFPSLFLIPGIMGIVFIDLAGTFSYSDLPFALACVLYILFIVIQGSTSKATFIITLFFLFCMGLSYVPTGAGQVTERFGEWFYLSFLFGIIQYTREALSREKS